MTTIDKSMTVAEIVSAHPLAAKVFQRHRIDFCCGGGSSVDIACEAKGLPAENVYRELEAALVGTPSGLGDARTRSTPALIAHLIAHHHEPLRTTLPEVLPMMKKVARVHGEHNPKLVELEATYLALSEALIPHLDQEEEVLFPALMSGQAGIEIVERELASMFTDHLAVAKLLERMHSESDGFTVPEWGCNTYRALISELQALEADLHEHIHLENHVLMPRFSKAGPRETVA